MPNVKIYVDDRLFPDLRAALDGALLPARSLLCRELGVDVPACQFAVMPVLAMPDLPAVNVELHVLPRSDRTRDRVTEVGLALRGLLGAATGQHVAVRIAFLDAATYVALK